MIYLENPSTDPAYNLALEEYLVMHDTREIAMLWRNDPAVIVGRNQCTADQVDRTYAEAHGIVVVRRLSGGGAVYHDAGNLNFTLIVRDATRRISDFDFFTRPLIEVLRTWGVDAEFSGRNDVIVDGKKFSGNAQYNHGSTVLHHGTILWESDLARLVKVLKPKQRVLARGVDSHRARVTNLASYLPGVSLEQFKGALIERLCSSDVFCSPSDAGVVSCLWGGDSTDPPSAFTALLSKYRSDAWNWGEGPDADVTRANGSFPASC